MTNKQENKGCGKEDKYGKKCGDDAERSDGIKEKLLCPECQAKNHSQLPEDRYVKGKDARRNSSERPVNLPSTSVEHPADTLQKIFEGCGKTIPSFSERHKTGTINICQKGLLCELCKAQAKGYIQRTKEELKFLEKLMKGQQKWLTYQIIKLKSRIQNCKETIKSGEENE